MLNRFHKRGIATALVEGMSGIVHYLLDMVLNILGDMVRHERYERVKELNNRFKSIFVDLAENERQRGLHAKTWPYQ